MATRSGRKPPRWVLHRIPRKGLRFLAEVRMHKISAASLIQPFLYMLGTKLGGVVMLFIALRAVGQAPDIQVPLMAYVVGMVFLMVAPVFQGIGVVEVSMAVALQRQLRANVGDRGRADLRPAAAGRGTAPHADVRRYGVQRQPALSGRNRQIRCRALSQYQRNCAVSGHLAGTRNCRPALLSGENRSTPALCLARSGGVASSLLDVLP